MSIQYKSADGWKNISSSSNNAVDTVENGNMNPVTSNAVYDTLNTVTTGIGTVVTGITAADAHYVKYGRVVNVAINQLTNQSGSDIAPSHQTIITGFPKAALVQIITVNGGLTFDMSPDGNMYFTGATIWKNNASTWFSFTYIASE